MRVPAPSFVRPEEPLPEMFAEMVVLVAAAVVMLPTPSWTAPAREWPVELKTRLPACGVPLVVTAVPAPAKVTVFARSLA